MGPRQGALSRPLVLLTWKNIQSVRLIKDYQHAKFNRDRLRNDGEIATCSWLVKKNKKRIRTRIEPVGEPYRDVCLSPWKGNWRISKNRIDWRNVLLSVKNYFHEKELKENGNMT